MSFASPAVDVARRVTLSGTKRSIDESTEATATTVCSIFLNYNEMYEKLAEDLVRKREEEYKLSLEECNNVLESHRVALNTVMHSHQQSNGLQTSEIEGYYVSSFDWALLEAHDKLKQEVKELKSDLLAEQHDDTLAKQLEEATKQLNDLNETAKQRDGTNDTTINLLMKERDEAKKKCNDMSIILNEMTIYRNETLKQLNEMTKKSKQRNEANHATIKHLTNERDETKKWLQSMTKERDETSKQLNSLMMERDETMLELDEVKTKLDERSDETSKQLNFLTMELNETTTELDETILELQEMTAKHNAIINILTNEHDKTKKEHDKTKKELDKTTTELDKTKSQFDKTKSQLDKTMLKIDEITMVRNLLMERLNEQSDETNKLLAEHYATIESQRNELELQSALLAKREATINNLTNERKSLTMDLDEAINEKTSIAKLLSTVSQERNSFFENLKRDKDLLKEQLDELEKEMSSRSRQQTSLASRSVDIQAENQRLERDIEACIENNETLAAENSTLAIDKMSLEGQLTDARDEADELLADNDVLRKCVSQLETQFETNHESNDESNVGSEQERLCGENDELREQLEQLRSDVGEGYDPIAIPMKTTVDQFEADIRPAVAALKNGSLADTLSRHDIPNEVKQVLVSRVNETDIYSRKKFSYRLWNNMMQRFKESLKDAKAWGGFSDCPESISYEFMIESIGKDQEGLAQHFYDTCDLYNEQELRLHYGLTVQIEHLGCRWIQFHLVWAKTFKELCQIHHFTALTMMPCQGNNAKGNLPVGELRRRINPDGEFVEWYAVRHFSPAIRNIERIVVNSNVRYFEEFARNGGPDRVFLEGAALAFNQNSKNVKYHYNTETNSIELEASTVVGNATIVLSTEVEATLVEFSAKFFRIATFDKTWRVNEKAHCPSNPSVTQTRYLTGKYSIYIDEETGQHCSYFNSITIDTNQIIESPSDRDFVIGSRSGKAYKRFTTQLNEQTKLLDYYSIHLDYKKGGPLSNAAGIYTKRVFLCILAFYYTDELNQRWRILKKCGNEYMEATIVDAFKALKEKYENLNKKKKIRQVRNDDDENSDDDLMQE